MKMTLLRARGAPKPGAPDRRIEKLHGAFLAKLRNDRVRLTILAAQLSRGGGTAHTLEDIRLLAHGVRGAAATFSATEVGIAAQALERVAAAESVLEEGDSEVDLWAALEDLRDLLGSVGGGRAAL
jgi:HPt (histidine-containing phosphotransfer) domain-containing protein